MGGCGADEIEDPSEKPDPNAPRIVSERIYDLKVVTEMLCRKEEVAITTARTTDAKQNMRTYGQNFKEELQKI